MVKVHYNEATRKVEGFYPDFIEYVAIPEPYVEVTDERHAQLVAEVNNGQELYLTSANEFALREIQVVYTEEMREAERIAEYRWVDDQISKCEREKFLANADLTALNGKIKALRVYANEIWATQEQTDYPQTVTYPQRPLFED